MTDLLSRLIQVDTTNPPGNETAAAELLRDYLQANGLQCELFCRTRTHFEVGHLGVQAAQIGPADFRTPKKLLQRGPLVKLGRQQLSASFNLRLVHLQLAPALGVDRTHFPTQWSQPPVGIIVTQEQPVFGP